MKASELAWKKIEPIYDQIISHPFIQKMIDGTLDPKIFSYYMEQDSIYLKDYIKCNNLIIKKIYPEYKKDFINHTIDTLDYIKYVENYFISNDQISKTGFYTTATIGYGGHLLKSCSLDPVEVEVAVILPCEYIYKELGLYIYNNSVDNNPYEDWINSYIDPEYIASVDNLISIYDELASNTTYIIKEEMLEIFSQSSTWELHFFNNSYYLEKFNEIC